MKNPDISDIPMETWHPFDASKNLIAICNAKDAKKHPVSRGITWNSAYILESLEPLFEIYKNKTIKPNSQEVEENNPSRSAKLRYVVRSKDNFIYPEDLEKKFFHYLELEKTYVQ